MEREMLELTRLLIQVMQVTAGMAVVIEEMSERIDRLETRLSLLEPDTYWED